MGENIQVKMDLHEFFNSLLYNDGSPAPLHGHCGYKMVRDERGYYYCKHCKDLAREEAESRIL